MEETKVGKGKRRKKRREDFMHRHILDLVP